jgi:hypothetical protein
MYFQLDGLMRSYQESSLVSGLLLLAICSDQQLQAAVTDAAHDVHN